MSLSIPSRGDMVLAKPVLNRDLSRTPRQLCTRQYGTAPLKSEPTIGKSTNSNRESNSSNKRSIGSKTDGKNKDKNNVSLYIYQSVHISGVKY